MNGHPSSPTDGAGRNGILASMCLALVLVVASVPSLNLALTGISLDLGTTSSQLTWIADGDRDPHGGLHALAGAAKQLVWPPGPPRRRRGSRSWFVGDRREG